MRERSHGTPNGAPNGPVARPVPGGVHSPRPRPSSGLGGVHMRKPACAAVLLEGVAGFDAEREGVEALDGGPRAGACCSPGVEARDARCGGAPLAGRSSRPPHGRTAPMDDAARGWSASGV